MSMPGVSPAMTVVLADLLAEGAELDALVAADRVDFAAPTPAVGWTIAHQIGHLTWTDELAVLCCGDPDGFAATRRGIVADLAAAIEAGAAAAVGRPVPEVLSGWRDGRAAVVQALRGVPPGTRLPWLGPPMGAGTMAGARITETWAHGQDVADALGAVRAATDRLRHVADLGVRTRDHSFVTHGLAPPDASFRVELISPSGAVWAWGPAEADQRLTGQALDFCLLVTRRRHPDDLDLSTVGEWAALWLTIAQAFAGPPGAGRPPER